MFNIWNLFKRGSDTVTKLIDSFGFIVPFTDSCILQAEHRLVEHQLLIILVVVLHLFHIGTS